MAVFKRNCTKQDEVRPQGIGTLIWVSGGVECVDSNEAEFYSMVMGCLELKGIQVFLTRD